jgi:glutamyl-tRNA reductase
LTRADLVVGATGAQRPVVTLDDYRRIEHDRFQRLLFVLDLGVPRDFDPAIGECLGVYLYSLDDLQAACDRNRKSREREWPKAERIIDEETRRFMAELHHRATGPTIKRLKARAEELKTEELARLLNKLPGLDVRSREEIERAFERLVNKLLHPPLESLRDEAQEGTPHGLLEALKRLFQLKD